METATIFAQYGDIFGKLINNGFDALMPYAEGLAYIFIGFSVIAACMGPMFHNSGAVAAAVRTVMYSGGYIGLIHAVPWLNASLLESATKWGLEAGGSGQSAQDFVSGPDSIFLTGYAHANTLFDMAGQMCTIFSWNGCGDPGAALSVYFAGWLVCFSFFLPAFLILSTVILFKMACLLGILLLPLATLEATRSFGAKPITSAIHFAVQIATIACMTSVGSLIFSRFELNPGNTVPGIGAAMPYVVASVVFVGLILGASRLAYSLTSGALLAGGALLGAPGGMAMAGARSGINSAIDIAGPAASSVTKKMTAMAAAGRRAAGA